MAAAAFLRNLIAAVPYKIHTVLTDNGIQFTTPAMAIGSAADHGSDRPSMPSSTSFDRVCRENGIEHRLTKSSIPWTNGQVERMNRTIKEATVKRFHYDEPRPAAKHLADFIAAYNFGRRLKTLKGLTPYEFICKQWTNRTRAFSLNPIHQMPGLNT
jgi:transposase InsO family protein